MAVGCLLELPGRVKRINFMSGLKTCRDKMGRIRWEGGGEIGLKEIVIGGKARIEGHGKVSAVKYSYNITKSSNNGRKRTIPETRDFLSPNEAYYT